MKFIQLLLAMLLCIAIASASTDYSGQCSIKQIQVDHYTVDQVTMVTYSVTLTNLTNRKIRSLYISSHQSLVLKDNNSYTNIERMSNGELCLPNELQIPAYGSHTFHITVKSTVHVDLFIKSIQYY